MWWDRDSSRCYNEGSEMGTDCREGTAVSSSIVENTGGSDGVVGEDDVVCQ